MTQQPTKQEIRDVTRKAVGVFERHGLSCCLFGGAGCELYGCPRPPNDVDLIVMTSSYTTAELKNVLVNYGGGDFYTRPSKKIGATYRLLYCKLPSRLRPRSCKVDILIPGILNIPTVPSDKIVHIDGLPVLPFMALLMLKVQGWSDHRGSDRTDYRQKQFMDKRDIAELLTIGERRRETLVQAQWLPHTFLEHGLQLIGRYVTTNGGSTAWEKLGIIFTTELQ